MAWTLVIAISFYWLSNPLVFSPIFELSLARATLACVAITTATFLWIRVPNVSRPLVVYMAFILLSAFWSQNSEATLGAWQLYAVIAFIAVVTHSQVTPRVLAQGFIWGGVIVALTSIYAMHELLPGSYFFGADGQTLLIGVGTNQNILAYTMTLALCGVCADIPRRPLDRLRWAATAGLIVYTLVITESSTGELTAVAVVGTALAFAALAVVAGPWKRWSARRRLGIVGLVVLGSLGFIAIAGRDILTTVGTLSGRTPLWRVTIEVARDDLWFGSGFGSVWQHPWKLAPDNPVFFRIYEALGVVHSHGHNAFIDLLPEVGLIGLALVIAILGSVAIGAWRRWRATRPGDSDRVMARFSVLVLVHLIFFGISEPMLSIPLGWWALVLITEPFRSPRRPKAYDLREHTELVTEKL